MTPSRSGPAVPGSTATRATVSTADVHFLDLHDATPAQLDEAARLLVEGFAEHFPRAWPTVEDGAAEVAEAMEEGRVARLAVGDRQRVLGWIGGIPMYEGRVWELHPLVVHPELQRQGIGRTLVGELERIVRERGGLTIFLGTDDETEQTTLGGVDLYPGALDKLAAIENLNGHPFEFYERVGFEIVGVVPDANGFGKPDIMMAKRVAP